MGHLDPFTRRRRIRDAVRAVLMAAADDGVQIVVVEDLHWIDEDTQAVLDDIVDAAHGAALHLVVTYRPEYIDRWTDRPHHALITLAPLAGSAAVQLVGDLLGDDPSVGTLRHALLSRTGGTPLFLEETVRALGRVRHAGRRPRDVPVRRRR